MTPNDLRRALAQRCDQTRYARWNGRSNVLEDAPLPDPMPERFGLFPIARGESVTRVGVLDFDNHGDPPLPWGEVVAAARPVVAHLQRLGHYPMAFRSTGGRGIHVWLAWDAPQEAATVRELLSHAAESCGLAIGARGLAAGEVEIFPKQDAVPADGAGSPIDPPLAGQSAALDPGDLSVLDVVPMLVTSVAIAAAAAPPPSAEPEKSLSIWDDVAIKAALSFIPSDDYGTWIDVLRALKGGAKKAKVDDAKARDIAHEWSKKSTFYSAREFALKWDRGFKKEASGKGRGLGTLFYIAERNGWVRPPPPCSIVKIRRQDSEPPLWLITIAGHEDVGEIRMDDMDLMSEQGFKRAVLRSPVNRIVKAPTPDQLNDLLKHAEIIPADEDSTTLGRFKARLLAFLDEHLSAEVAEVRTERAWHDTTSGRTWFRWTDAESWFRRHRWYDVHHSDAFRMVRNLGGGLGNLDLGAYGKIRAWWVPLDPRTQTPEPPAAEVPKDVEGPI